MLLAEGHDAQGRHAQQRGDVRLVLVLLLQLVPLQLQVAACTHGLWLHGDSYYNTDSHFFVDIYYCVCTWRGIVLAQGLLRQRFQ